MKTKAIRVITIKSGIPEDNGKRIKVCLFRIAGKDKQPGFAWYLDGESTGVSGETVEQACWEARKAWAGSAWDLRAKSSNF